MTTARIPTATYRVQFHSGFTFSDAAAIIPYLHRLGISDLYASPYFQATPGSAHGYDVTDHNTLNPEVGGPEGYAALTAALAGHQMSQVVDFVPNHMGVSESSNEWWRDALENGPSAVCARFFDIDWDPPQSSLRGKVLIPTLEDHIGKVLEAGKLKVETDENGGFRVSYYEKRFPLDPKTYAWIWSMVLPQADDQQLSAALEELIRDWENLPEPGETDGLLQRERAMQVAALRQRSQALLAEAPRLNEAIAQALSELNGKPGEPRSFDGLERLLAAQKYRLCYWRAGSEELNYRRFFDVDQLIALRVEIPEVFTASHQLLGELFASGAVTGVRIDHIDGLWDPQGYLEALQGLYREKTGGDELYLLVEKILEEDETLPESWPVHGTTGYDFLCEVARWLIDADAENRITGIYRRFTGERWRFRDLSYQKKKLVISLSLTNTASNLGAQLHRLSEGDRRTRDFTVRSLSKAIEEMVACLPVYRTYRRGDHEIQPADREVIAYAAAEAIRRNPALDPKPFEFTRDVLLSLYPTDQDTPARQTYARRWIMRFQQFTGAVMAKGVEDTVFYLYNRLNALNDVGGNLARFSLSADEFHLRCRRRWSHWPHAMLTTSTHDTKLSEDVRARLSALSEVSDEWERGLEAWRELNRDARTDVDGDLSPDANEEYLLYQVMVGSWPLAGPEVARQPEYLQRLQGYARKAINEGKRNSSWTQPNEAWLESVAQFLAKILSAESRFPEAFDPFAQSVAWLGMLNSLRQVTLKLTAPGVPDIYQGNEVWDFSLVDPDNRRPVDYLYRQRLMDEIDHRPVEDMWRNWQDGGIKLWLTRQLLTFRRQHPRLFLAGSYEPVEASGPHASRLLAFLRQAEGEQLLVIVSRLTAPLGPEPVGPRWEGTQVAAGEGDAPWTCVLTEEKRSARNGAMDLSGVFSALPIAVLWRRSGSGSLTPAKTAAAQAVD
jgi:(1->4)-alpha-D-glucan 1-alpha-D-glucosylmutase